MSLTAAGLIATAVSFVLFTTAAVWYAGPWMSRHPLGVALSVPLWVHTFRYVALQIFSAQKFGFRISDGVTHEIAWSDVAGASLALAALWLLRRDSKAATPVVWLFVVETIVDLVNATVMGIREGAAGTAHAVTWLILDLYVPLLWVTLALLVWRLISRPRVPASWAPLMMPAPPGRALVSRQPAPKPAATDRTRPLPSHRRPASRRRPTDV